MVIGQRRYTLEEYLAFEWDAPWRHYFHGGVVRPMPFASGNKSKITGNLIREVGNAMEDADFHLYLNIRMLCIPAVNLIFYPNFMIVKGKEKLHFFNERMNVNLNPCALLEVEETFDYNKWNWYREIPSLQQYFMISQTEVYIDIYNRMGDSDEWKNTYVNKMEQTIRVAEFDISVAKIYQKVVFPENTASEEMVL